MSVANRAGVLPKAIIAAFVGTVAGGAAGVWSLRQPAAGMNVSASPLPAPQVTTTHITKGVAAAHDDADVLQRARKLARLPDVTALIALRNEVVRQATEAGVAGALSIKGELDEIDLRLNEARRLRLRLDAEELRKADSTRSE